MVLKIGKKYKVKGLFDKTGDLSLISLDLSKSDLELTIDIKGVDDGKEINYELEFSSDISSYSIKEDFTPILKRSIFSGSIVCFTGKNKGFFIVGNSTYNKGEFSGSLIPFYDKGHWEDV